MFEIKVRPTSPKGTTQFLLIKENALMGHIIIYPSKVTTDRGILDIFIKPKYRSRWLARDFAKQIKSTIIATLKEKNFTLVLSKALSSQSPRILEFFGFKRYNNSCYFLII
jgi:hypothetical protein